MDITQSKLHELLQRYGDRPIEVFSTPIDDLQKLFNQLLNSSNEYANRKFSLQEWVKEQSQSVTIQINGEENTFDLYSIMQDIFSHSVFDADLQTGDRTSIVDQLEEASVQSILAGKIEDQYLTQLKRELKIFEDRYTEVVNDDGRNNSDQIQLNPLLAVFVTIQKIRIKEKYTDFLIAFKSDYKIKQEDLTDVENMLYSLNQDIVINYQEVLDNLNNMTLDQVLSPILQSSTYIATNRIMTQIAAQNYLVGISFSNFMYALELLADFESSDIKKNKYLDGIIQRWDQLDRDNLVFSHHITSLLNLQEMFSMRASQEIILNKKIEHRHKQKSVSDQMFDLLVNAFNLQSKLMIPRLSKSTVISKFDELSSQMRNPLLFNEIFSVYIQEKTNDIRSNSILSIDELQAFIDMHLSVMRWIMSENPDNSFVKHRANYLISIAKLQSTKLDFKKTIIDGVPEGSLFEEYMSLGSAFKECEEMVATDPVLASQVNVMFSQCMIQASNVFVPDSDGDASVIAIPLNLAFSGMTEASRYALQYSNLKASQYRLRAEALRSIWSNKIDQLGFPSVLSNNRLQSLKNKFADQILDPSHDENFNIQIETIMDELGSIMDTDSDDEETKSKLRTVYQTMKNYTEFMDLTNHPPSTSMSTNQLLLKEQLETLKDSTDPDYEKINTIEHMIETIENNEIFADSHLKYSNINSMEFENWITLEDLTNEDGHGFLMI